VARDDEVREAIGGLLAARAEGRTICPSEAARAVFGDDAFRPHMQEVRDVAFALADAGEIQVTQRGEVVDGRTARGPIRLRAVRREH
jgi:hypothetical protein